MRIALLADIHGNEIALSAVLRDIEARGGVNAYWILGDLVALGPQPVQVLEILSALPNTRFIRGIPTDMSCLAIGRPRVSRKQSVFRVDGRPGRSSQHFCLDAGHDYP